MNHRVSIVVNSTSAMSRLKVESERPKFARKPAASQNQSFQKNVCTALFFFSSWTMRRVYLLFASRAYIFLNYIVFLSRVNARQWCPRKDQALHSIGSFHPFLLAVFFFSCCQLTIHSRALRLSVCCELQAADEKNLTPQRQVFSRSSQHVSALRTHVWEGMRKSTKRIVHVRFPYTLRSLESTLSEFFYQAWRVYEVFVDRLFFFSLFCESVETEITQERDQKRHQKRDFETQTRSISTDSLFDCRWSPTACRSLTFFKTKTARLCRCSHKPTSCRPVM